MTVSFFGSRDATEEIIPSLRNTIEELIQNEGAKRFYVGNNGAFDRHVIFVLREMEKKHDIDVAVVLAYMPGKKENFDYDTIYPESLAGVPHRFAINERNLWMIEQADCVITYISRAISCAEKFKRIAVKKGKRVIELYEYGG